MSLKFEHPAARAIGEIDKEKNLQKDQADLIALLEMKHPTTFSPSWIRNNGTALYDRVNHAANGPEGFYGWDRIVSSLENEWKSKWRSHERTKSRSLEEDVCKLMNLFESEDPKVVGTEWLWNKDRKLYKRLFSKAINPEGKNDWEQIVALLDEKWKKRWLHKKPMKMVERGRTMAEEAPDLTASLEAQNPPSFGPRWIQEHAEALYLRILKKPRLDKDVPDWESLIASLDDKWKKRWTYQKNSKDLEKDMTSLVQLLKTKDPSIINPSWIQEHDSALYKRLCRKAQNEKRNKVDWTIVTSLLDEKWRSRWRHTPRRFMREHLPEKTYEDAREVDEVLKKHKGSLYAFITVDKPELKLERDAICSELILLAQKGNKTAEERLISLFSMVIEDWLDKYPYLSFLKHDPEKIEKTLKLVSIYLTQRDQNHS